jgi:hypothetical protein
MIGNVVISEVEALLYVVINEAEKKSYKRNATQTEVVINESKCFTKMGEVLNVQ